MRANISSDRPPQEGGIFRRKWWRHYAEPAELKELVSSWDMAFKDTDGSDYVVGQLWGRDLADKYLLARARDRRAIGSLGDRRQDRTPTPASRRQG
jgi:phage terminase large subunit-like protein